ncbi:MAG: hypothetical protein LBU44_08455 [Mediterranea sp.]|jgi:hypothetical protein|nr:hypothetical protein [Mediterranea sp.]
MKRFLFILTIGIITLASCSKDESGPPCETEQTLFLYMPWSSNLTPYFSQNIADLETAVKENILKNNRLIVFFSSSATEAFMFEITCKNGQAMQTVLRKYKDPAFTTVDGIASILNDVKHFAPANRYAMVIGSHGMGWLPVAGTKARAAIPDEEKYHWEYEGYNFRPKRESKSNSQNRNRLV